MTSPLDWPYPPFTVAEARESGISRQRLRRLLAQRQVRKVLRGVYQSVEALDTIASRAEAAALVMPPFAIVCDRTAAWIHGVDVVRYRELDVPPPLDVVVLRYARRQNRSEWRNGERDLASRDVMRVNGLRVTTPLRTALDLACKLPRRDALAAVDQFMRVHELTRDDLRRELPRYFRRRGVVQLRAIVAAADPRAESPAESWVRMAIMDAGLPAPEVQYSVIVDGAERYRLDLAYPRHRICIEYDGVEFHTAPADRRADADRRDWLRQRGWTVIVLTRDDLRADAAGDWLDALRAQLFEPTPWPRG
jgi:very-short-patch-repair endonuclease